MCLIASRSLSPNWNTVYKSTQFKIVRDNANNESVFQWSARRLLYTPRHFVQAVCSLTERKPFWPGDSVPEGAEVNQGLHTLGSLADARKFLALMQTFEAVRHLDLALKIIRVEGYRNGYIASGHFANDPLPYIQRVTNHVWASLYVPKDCHVLEPEKEELAPCA